MFTYMLQCISVFVFVTAYPLRFFHFLLVGVFLSFLNRVGRVPSIDIVSKTAPSTQQGWLVLNSMLWLTPSRLHAISRSIMFFVSHPSVNHNPVSWLFLLFLFRKVL